MLQTFKKKIFAFVKSPLCGVVVLSFLFTLYFYAPILLHPAKYLLNDKGDAIKNYYCYAWHVYHDTSLVNYTGTNYPYGELHGYTDGNPLLGNIFKLFPFIKAYAIPVFNLSIVLSFVFCSILLYRIFEELNVRKLHAVIAALGISILCPQVFRMPGHLTLAYSFFMPLTIYLLILYEKRERKLYYSIITGIVQLCFFLIHPYLGMISTFFMTAFLTLKILFNLRQIKKLILPLLLQAVLPIVLFFTYTRFTDTHTDRTTEPYGFHFFLADIETVFISTCKPFRHFLSLLYRIKQQNWEGIAYVGLTTDVVLICLPVFLLFKRRKLKQHFKQNPLDSALCFMGISSFLLLLFAMGYPFKWGMTGILESFPTIKQFRAPGRFAWAFYFTATIFATVFISRYFLPSVKQKARDILCCMPLLLFAVEGIPYHQLISKGLVVENVFNKGGIDNEWKEIISNLRQTKAQAIIPLPYFNIGTDYYVITGTENIRRASFILSFHAQIPLMANLTPRTSISESGKLIGVLGTDMLTKEIQTDIKSKSSFCLLYSREQLTEEEQQLYNKGTSIYETQHFVIKEISYEQLFETSAQRKISYFESHRSALIKDGDFYKTDSSWFRFINFDSLPDQIYTAPLNQLNCLTEIKPFSLEKDSVYELSLIYFSENDRDIDNHLMIKQRVNGADSIVSRANINTMVNIRPHAIMATLSFKALHPEWAYTVCFKGLPEAKDNFTADNLMIRQKSTTVYRKEFSEQVRDTVLRINNFVLPEIKIR